MNEAKLTVCIPAYNREDFLRDALASLCDQGLQRDEYVVAISDDASPTPLESVIAPFKENLQIVYDRSNVNIGHIANFERVFHLARTPYVSLLPHDDVMAPGHLARVLPLIEENPG